MTSDAEAPEVGPVQSLERGLAVLRAFDADHPRMTLSDVARRTGLTRASARRFLHTLVMLGYASTDGREFWLRPRVLELGYAYLSSSTLPEIATPHLEDLTAQVHESSSVSVLDGTDIVYVARVPTRRIMTVAISIGTRFPAYATSMGRVLLAGLDDDALDDVLTRSHPEHLTARTTTDLGALRTEIDTVRTQGWAMVDQELEPGLRSIAVPVHAPDGTVAAAANVSTTASQVSAEEARDAILPRLRDAAMQIERDLRAAG